MRKKHHKYNPEEKVFILKRHLVERVPLSDLCNEYQLQPMVFYSWQKQFFENGSAAFGSDERSERRREVRRNQQVEEKRTRKSDIFSELMAEHIKLTSEYGGL
jgi:transposase-like protein